MISGVKAQIAPALASHYSDKGMGWRQEYLLYFLACLIGVLAAFAAMGFDLLIHWTEAVCYGSDHLSGIYQGRMVFLFLLPASGALLVGLIARFYSREAVGHGIPEVIDAIVRRDCKIGFHVALARMVTAALTIGSGGSAGTEGPIIQIGSSIASSMGRHFHVVRHRLPVLIACGAAAGLSAIFNAPIAGVLFALEVFLRDMNFKILSPVLIASVVSSVVMSTLRGKHGAIFPLYDLTAYSFSWYELGNYIVLGLVCAGTAVAFIRVLDTCENLFERVKTPLFVKPVIGALCVGLVGLLTLVLTGQGTVGKPLIYGHGYSFIGYCLGSHSAAGFMGVNLSVWLMLVLIAGKIIATSLTLGSGGSGGIFAPSLFLGATTGYAFGLLLEMSGVYMEISPATYSLVGMASVMAATTHAPMASIVLLFEMTQNYTIILPVMLSATIALLVGQRLCGYSVSSLRLHRLGVRYGLHTKTALLRRFSVRDIMTPGTVVVSGTMPLQEIILKTAEENVSDFIVVDKNGRYRGLLCEKDMRNTLVHPQAIPLIVGEELAHWDVPVVSVDDTLDLILDIFAHLEVNSLPVADRADSTRFVGMVSRFALMRLYMDELQSGG
jgi:CIC family chloride channel protein